MLDMRRFQTRRRAGVTHIWAHIIVLDLILQLSLAVAESPGLPDAADVGWVVSDASPSHGEPILASQAY